MLLGTVEIVVGASKSSVACRNCMRDPQPFKTCLHLRRCNLFTQPHYLMVFFFTLGELSSSVAASGEVDFVSIWCYNSVVSYRQREGMETPGKHPHPADLTVSKRPGTSY